MRIKITDEQSSGIHILILLAVALAVGLYLIIETTLIAKDGTTFIEYARGFETSPIETMRREYQHPGYPFLIFAAHKITDAVGGGTSVMSWIYSAQAVTLGFRLLAVIMLYFAGKKIVGARASFWAILILILLPDPARLGSDALSDWPFIFFLSAGYLLLIWGAMSGKWWLFGFSGLAAGMGYLIRPECAQIVIFGALWLVLQLFWTQRSMNKYKAAIALVLLAAGFLAIAGPYMKLKGAVFPKKQLVELAANTQSTEVSKQEIRNYLNDVYSAGFVPSDIAGALGKLVQRVSETLMWFFIPALLIGMHKNLRRRDWREPEKFFVIVLIVLNVFIMTLLHCKFGYMSRRHTLPLVVFTIFYIPAGLDVLASWLGEKLSKATANFRFIVLLVIGIAICIPKLLSPVRAEKQVYRDAAKWLSENTEEGDTIAVSDARIGFYSGRRSIKYNGAVVPKEAKYAVIVFEEKKGIPSGEETLSIEETFEGKEEKVIIYKQTNQDTISK